MTHNEGGIKIELTEEKVNQSTDSEKLDLLVKIAFETYREQVAQGKLLYGNGNPKEGLCYKVATTSTKLNWLIAILSACGGIMLSALVAIKVL